MRDGRPSAPSGLSTNNLAPVAERESRPSSPSGLSTSNLPPVSAHAASQTYARGQLPPSPAPSADEPRASAPAEPIPSVPARLAAAVFGGKTKATAPAPAPAPAAAPRGDAPPPMPSVPARFAAAAFSKKGLAPAPAPSVPPSHLPLPSAPARFAQTAFRGSTEALGRRAAAQLARRTYEECVARVAAGDWFRAPSSGTPAPDDPTGALDVALGGLILGGGPEGLYTFPTDAALASVAAFEPLDGPTEAGTVVEVGELGQSATQQLEDAQALADRCGKRVVALHVASGSIGGDPIPAAEALFDGNASVAVAALTEVLVGELAEGRPVHVVALRRGGWVVATALGAVLRLCLRDDGPADPAVRSRMRAALAASVVECFGESAGRFPEGPRYVHYLGRRARQTDDERARLGGARASLVTLAALDDVPFLVGLLQHRLTLAEVDAGYADAR